ncbi:MAG: nucleotidyltransferase [Candidatus Nitrohelix vancouverensis]|uniref:Nucleotidyltransferase n=1 Tax=Candidatus Nitrohelix vancouverensis TaxID=2705534 RepID=A0A7T0C2J4_9BACT|nr:MAG: nucleotidyltransferase [Candidatus Nitrohelix vancouverensis]
MTTELQTDHNQLFKNIQRELDISPSKYQQAVDRYTAVGNWLEKGTYRNPQDVPHIYPQGSFRLGTVIRPLKEGKESDYDIDLVCELQTNKRQTTPGEIKLSAGSRLKEHETYKDMLDEEGRRCWTLNYSEEDGVGFHLDVLPSVPEPDQQYLSCNAIAITDKKDAGSYEWSTSDPNGYADWFDEKNRPTFELIQFSEKNRIFMENKSVFAQVDKVPDQLVKTPLQGAIQILKRHRDQRFSEHDLEEDKPISMIITTLSAELYNQEPDILSALKGIVGQLLEHSKLVNPGWYEFKESYAGKSVINRKSDEEWYIPNPVNPNENFADRWHENNHRKAKAFFRWVAWVQEDLIEILDQYELEDVCEALQPILGKDLVQKASKGLLVASASNVTSGADDDHPRIEIKNPSQPWGLNER